LSTSTTLLCYTFVCCLFISFFFFQAEDGIRDPLVTGVQTCALPICPGLHSERPPKVLHSSGECAHSPLRARPTLPRLRLLGERLGRFPENSDASTCLSRRRRVDKSTSARRAVFGYSGTWFLVQK